MLINFSVGNFRSFKETVTFSMVAAKITAKNKELDRENVFRKGNLSLLKSASIYGANASGKSNLLQAFSFIKNFVLRSTSTTSKDSIDVDPFLLSTETENAPSFFEVVFLLDNVRYRYGFEVDQNRVHAEWLYRTIKREAELFWREGDKIDPKAGFKEGKGLEERTRSNALFLSVADQWNGDIAGQIVGWFKNAGIISGLEDRAYLGFTVDQMVEGKPLGRQITEFVRRLDFGISDITAEKLNVEQPGFLSVLQQADNISEEIKKPYPWFLLTLRMETEKAISRQNEAEGNRFKKDKMPEHIKDILRGMLK